MADESKGTVKGKPQGQIHAVFSNRIDDLKAKAADTYNAYVHFRARPWDIPFDYEGSLQDIPNLHEPSFNRDAINTNYETATSDVKTAGTNGDIMSLKLQMDYVAAEERAFRLRHATPTRALNAAMGRKAGQGRGAIFTRIREEAESLIATGGS